MKRGFLNNKKVRHQPSYDNANLAMVAPPKHLGDSATAISRMSLIYMYFIGGSDSAPTILSGPEPAVGFSKSKSQLPGSYNDDLPHSALG